MSLFSVKVKPNRKMHKIIVNKDIVTLIKRWMCVCSKNVDSNNANITLTKVVNRHLLRTDFEYFTMFSPNFL